jgi:hypothetical protein
MRLSNRDDIYQIVDVGGSLWKASLNGEQK